MRYSNPTHKAMGLWDTIKFLVKFNPKKWPKDIKNIHTPQLPDRVNDGEIVVTFINHSTLLIQLEQYNILTDPVWSERASPFSWIGPKRVRPPGIELDKLPHIHLILLSHNHYDHMDLPTLKKLAFYYKPQVFVPYGDKKLLESHGIKNVFEMNWWDSEKIDDVTCVTFVPTQHFSARGLFDRNKSLWGSFMFKSKNQQFYFGGDAAYSESFQEIRNRLGAPDIAFLPIGAYEPNWFMKTVHMKPDEAVQAHLDLEAKLSIGIHFGTFQLTEEGFEEPKAELFKALSKRNISPKAFIVLEEGQTLVYPRDSSN